MRCIKKSVVHLGLDICKGEKMKELDSNKESPKELELDDLLISNNDEEPKNSGSGKKVILLGAIGILLFAIVVLVVYVLQGDSKEQAEQTPDQTLQKAELNPQVAQSQPSDFSQVPLDNASNTDDQFQRIIDQIKAKNQAQQNTGSATQNLPAIPEPKMESQEKQNIPVASQAPKKSIEPKAEAPKASAKDAFKSVDVSDPKLQGSEATTGFYVQVGSFSKFAPNKQLLGLIEKENFSYRMQKAGDNNRLLIGPYATKAEALEKINAIRAKINKDAFIKEIK